MRNRRWLALLLIGGGCHGGVAADEPVAEVEKQALAACGFEKMLEVRIPAIDQHDYTEIDCNMTLQPTDIITRRLVFSGATSSGAVLDCNGATIDGSLALAAEGRKHDTIEVRSTYDAETDTWDVPTDIEVRDCAVRGSVRVWGMSQARYWPDTLIEASRQPDYLNTVRAAAPRRILFANMTITAIGRNPFYVGQGVRSVTLVDSEITGQQGEIAIYLDAESQSNVIRNNYLHVSGVDSDHSQIAVDGSSHNLIVDNYFSALTGGGIYLYRNCGEDRIVRWSTPSYNTIVNNTFYYSSATNPPPSIFLGARNGGQGFCIDDSDYPGGSGADNRDFARYNVVMQNQIFKFTVADQIEIGKDFWTGATVNTPNYIKYNQTVLAEIDRLAGCYVPSGYTTDFMLDGDWIDLFQGGANGAPACNGERWFCNDGEISRVPVACPLRTLDFGCQAWGNDVGCSGTRSCPSGTRVVAARAGCNLEYGSVSTSALAAVPANWLKVLVASDTPSDGRCWAGSSTTAISKGSTSLLGLRGRSSVGYGCKEHDSNGGDCHVRGQLYCR